jgi:DNA-binding NarL/FixJ family response regulator
MTSLDQLRFGDFPGVDAGLECEDPHMKGGVLIVDDHASFRRLARKVLETGGFNVVGEAADGASTVRAVASLRPDVVLLDVVLPDTDGFTVAEALADEPSSPVVVLISSRSPDDLGRRLDPSAQRFLAKDEFSCAALEALLATP